MSSPTVEPVLPDDAAGAFEPREIAHRAAYPSLGLLLLGLTGGVLGWLLLGGTPSESGVWLWYVSVPGWWVLILLLGVVLRMVPLQRGAVSPWGPIMLMAAMGLHAWGHVQISDDPILALTPYARSLTSLSLEHQRIFGMYTLAMSLVLVLLLWSLVWRHATAVLGSVAARRGSVVVAWLKALLGLEREGFRAARAYHLLWLLSLYQALFALWMNGLAGLEHLGVLVIEMTWVVNIAVVFASVLTLIAAVLGVRVMRSTQ